METLAAGLEGFALAEWLRFSRWGYAATNTTHILGLALLTGAVVTLDLRLLGFWQATAVTRLYRILSTVAAAGLAIAIISGALLFSVRATEYVAVDLFFAKISLVVVGVLFALMVHLRVDIDAIDARWQKVIGAFSLFTWLSVLIGGRLLAFV